MAQNGLLSVKRESHVMGGRPAQEDDKRAMRGREQDTNSFSSPSPRMPTDLISTVRSRSGLYKTWIPSRRILGESGNPTKLEPLSIPRKKLDT